MLKATTNRTSERRASAEFIDAHPGKLLEEGQPPGQETVENRKSLAVTPRKVRIGRFQHDQEPGAESGYRFGVHFWIEGGRQQYGPPPGRKIHRRRVTRFHGRAVRY